MARPALHDDRSAVLRRLERHAGPEASAPDPALTRNKTRPGLSLRLVSGVLIVMAVILLGIWAPWQNAPTTLEVPAEEPAEPAEPATPAHSDPPPQALSTPEPAALPATITINVVGHVAKPGVHTLPEGARVVDAIEAAGGATEPADLTRLNLARVLSDEEYLAVLATSEDPPELLEPNAPAASGATPPDSSPSVGDSPGGGSVLNLNTATEEQLQSLPGVGPVMAGRIAAWREEHGGFRSVDELQEISGVGPKVFAQLEPLVNV